MTRETVAQRTDSEEEPWQALFSSGEGNGLNAWTTEQLLNEVLIRNTGDAPALRSMQARGLLVLLAALNN
jgi:hypothetical protein